MQITSDPYLQNHFINASRVKYINEKTTHLLYFQNIARH